MHSASVFLAFGLAVQQAAATYGGGPEIPGGPGGPGVGFGGYGGMPSGGDLWGNAPTYSQPGYGDCTPEQQKGCDFSQGKIDQDIGKYQDFDFGGFKCRGSHIKRSFTPRGANRNADDDKDAIAFDGNCASGRLSEHPNIRAPKDKEMNIDTCHISSDEDDAQFEAHYEMPDGSTCVQQGSCNKGGNIIKNTQCGGAKGVTFKPHKDGKDCTFNVHHIQWGCETPKQPPTKPVTTEESPKTSSTEVASSETVSTTSEGYQASPPPSESTSSDGYQASPPPSESTSSDGYEASPPPKESTSSEGYEATPPETTSEGYQATPPETTSEGYEATPPETTSEGYQAVPPPPETTSEGYEATPPETTSEGYEATPPETTSSAGYEAVPPPPSQGHEANPPPASEGYQAVPPPPETTTTEAGYSAAPPPAESTSEGYQAVPPPQSEGYQAVPPPAETTSEDKYEAVPPPPTDGGYEAVPPPATTSDGGYAAVPPPSNTTTTEGGYAAIPPPTDVGYPAQPPASSDGYEASPPPEATTSRGYFFAPPPPASDSGYPVLSAPTNTTSVEGGYPTAPPAESGYAAVPPPADSGYAAVPPPVESGYPGAPPPPVDGGYSAVPPPAESGYEAAPPEGPKSTMSTMVVKTISTVCPVTSTVIEGDKTYTTVGTKVTSYETTIGGAPPTDTPSNTETSTAETATPEVPVPATCPDTVPRCISTFLDALELTECKGNTDSKSYCASQPLSRAVIDCMYAHRKDDAEFKSALKHFQGLCADKLSENPIPLTYKPAGCPEEDDEPEQPTATTTGGAEDLVTPGPAPPAANGPYTTITVSTAVNVPCTYSTGHSAGLPIPSSFTDKTIQTVATVPQLGFYSPEQPTGAPAAPPQLIQGTAPAHNPEPKPTAPPAPAPPAAPPAETPQFPTPGESYPALPSGTGAPVPKNGTDIATAGAVGRGSGLAGVLGGVGFVVALMV